MSQGNFAKEQSKRHAKQQLPKGCSCKRSQCIKNYCDCYQSMVICSIYCKCIGCRNLEERLPVTTPPKKVLQAAKRERGAALSAKAAAKNSMNGNVKLAPGSTASQQIAAAPSPVPAEPVPILQMPELNFGNIITLQPPNAATTNKKPQPAQIGTRPSVPPREVNVCTQPVNSALLECLVAQAVEGEELGLSEVQVGQLVIAEFTRGLQAILGIYTNM